MNLACKKKIVTDPKNLEALRSCRSVSELEARLRMVGVECSHQEALRFLRTWNAMDDEQEALSADDLKPTSASKHTVGSVLRSLFRIHDPSKARSSSECAKGLTIADVLTRMNQ